MAAVRPEPTLCISGMTGEGLPDLLSLIASKLSASMEEVEVRKKMGVWNSLEDGELLCGGL